MFAQSDFPANARTNGSDRMLAAAAALVITGILLATAIVPASPALAYSALTIGVLA